MTKQLHIKDLTLEMKNVNATQQELEHYATRNGKHQKEMVMVAVTRTRHSIDDSYTNEPIGSGHGIGDMTLELPSGVAKFDDLNEGVPEFPYISNEGMEVITKD